MNESSCDCCQGVTQLTPTTVTNRPGLDAVAYRVGTHAAFFETMKARLSSMAVEVRRDQVDPNGPSVESIYPLRGLTTRDADDPAIALLDGWATVGDVLTFYQERIANEGFLRTATERRSVLELARLVGYDLRPGVAASTYLAYMIEPTHPEPVEIAVGTRVQSVPGPGELPQSFETGEKIEARATWNTLTPRMTQPQTQTSIENLPADMTTEHEPRIYLKGIATNLRANDPLLIDFGTGRPVFRRVQAVLPDPPNDRTLVRLQPWISAGEFAAVRSAVAEVDTRAVVAAPRTFVDAVRVITEKYLNLEAFNVAPNREMAERVVATLQELRASLRDEMPAFELSELLRDQSLPKLRVELTMARERSYRLLEGWVSGLVAELEQALTTTATSAESTTRAVAPSTAVAAGATTFGPLPQTESGSLVDVIRQLALAPSIPPRNSLNLDRNVSTTFAPTSDQGLQVVGALEPALRAALPVAAANAQTTLPNLVKAYALRVKAAPFGHNAPQKPVRDANGTVVSSEEWPLADTETIGVTLHLDYNDLPFHADLTVKRKTVMTTRGLDLGGGQSSTTIADMTVDFGAPGDIGEDTGFAVTFSRGGEIIRSLVYKAFAPDTDNPARREIAITITVGAQSDPEQTIPLNQLFNLQIGDRSITLNYYAEFGSESSSRIVSVVEEHALPLPTELQNVIALDASYDQIVPQSYVAILRAGQSDAQVAPVQRTDTVSKIDYNVPAKVTQLTLDDRWWDGEVLLSEVRTITVFAQSEALELAEEPIPDDICGGADNSLELDGLYSGLQSGRWLIVSGERTDITDHVGNRITGVEASELVMLAEVSQDVQAFPQTATSRRRALAGAGGDDESETGLPGDRLHTFIKLANPLAYCYKRETVTIYGNVVKATHGETRNEVLGSGDGSKALQSFTLRQRPLTYLPAAIPSGAESTLKVYVNHVEWHESDTLAGLTPTDRRFITRIDDDGKTTVIFGNGQQGSRLPTGAENVNAVYRNGIGKPGNVKASQISLLATRPLGVKSVINPMRASGGADKESRDQARRNAPLGVTALDRLVSVQDHADFTRTFAGIGKADARRLTQGRRQLVHVTIAGADDIPIESSSDLYRNLVSALHKFGDPDLPIQVDVRELLLLVISANVRILPDYLWEPVVLDIRASLLDRFGFERRMLGQDALLSEVISTIQAVEGVAYVDIELLGGIPEKTDDEAYPGKRRLRTPSEILEEIGKLSNSGELLQRIVVNLADVVTDNANQPIRPAQLAFLSPDLADTLILNRIT